MPSLEFKSNLLTKAQADIIVDTLVPHCNLLETSMPALEMFYDEEFCHNRASSAITAYMYKAFRTINVPDMVFRAHPYGKGYYLPELESDNVLLQVYGKSCDLKSIEIKNNCAHYNKMASNKRYGILKVLMSDKGHLTTIKLLTLDAKANVLREDTLYRYRSPRTSSSSKN